LKHNITVETKNLIEKTAKMNDSLFLGFMTGTSDDNRKVQGFRRKIQFADGQGIKQGSIIIF